MQIGARNMQTTGCWRRSASTATGAAQNGTQRPRWKELLLAAEYILNEGNPNVMLCERGIRTFENHTRFTLPLASVPYLHHKTHLPVVVDPSHGTGHTYLVPDTTAAAVAAERDGLILEVHRTRTALSDGYNPSTSSSSRKRWPSAARSRKCSASSLGRD